MNRAIRPTFSFVYVSTYVQRERRTRASSYRLRPRYVVTEPKRFSEIKTRSPTAVPGLSKTRVKSSRPRSQAKTHVSEHISCTLRPEGLSRRKNLGCAQIRTSSIRGRSRPTIDSIRIK